MAPSGRKKRQSLLSSEGSGLTKQLGSLRNFVGGGFSEKQLITSLRQTRYSIERAAELLLCGNVMQDENVRNPPPVSFQRKDPPKIVSQKPSPPKKSPPKAPPPANRLLLCKRWLSDCIVTSRNGRLRYQEQLEIDCSRSGVPLLKFRGRHVEGRLSKDISEILCPLMRENHVSIEASALMEDKFLKMGNSAPLQVSVFVNPDTFFGVFAASTLETSFWKQRAHKSTRLRSPVAEAAFQLLEFAENGNVPEFKPAETNEVIALDEDDDDEPESDTEGTSSRMLSEDLAHSELPLASSPKGLNVELRDYQRQALTFLLSREDEPTPHERKAHMDLLSELAKDETAMGPNKAASISCYCGPVEVNGRSQTLDGVAEEALTVPLWKKRYLASPDLKQSYVFYVNEFVRKATQIPPALPTICSGGILADAMGLGKTVMMLGLVCARPGTTLIVAKLSLLAQWEEEIQSKTHLTYKVVYGTTKADNLNQYDVVLTTYGMIQGELNRKTSVFDIEWHRIILDEAHCIRNQRTLASKVLCGLTAKSRWCVSGTVIQNSLEDIFGFMKFLRHEPWCFEGFWKTATRVDEENREESMKTALSLLRRLLNPIMIRRTKSSTVGGVKILELPKIETKVVKVTLSESEREFYNAVLARSREVFSGFVDSGNAKASYFQIFGMLQRLRQVCDHIALTVKSKLDDEEWLGGADEKPAALPTSTSGQTKAIGNDFLSGLLQKFCVTASSPRKRQSPGAPQSPDSKRRAFASSTAELLSQAVEEKAQHYKESECPICLEYPKMEEAVLTPCAHVFCKGCLVDILQQNGKDGNGHCPTCQKNVELKRVIVVSKEDNKFTTSFLTPRPAVAKVENGDKKPSAKTILETAITGNDSSKMLAIQSELEDVWASDPTSKVLIFSHYLGFLDLLGKQFKRNKVAFFRLDGSLSLKERMSVLSEFRDCPHRCVLLMSMAAGAEGLNITAANTCFILEPWWNSAKEDQCINRVHRIGQTSDVQVRKFVVEDSVEERIVELQARKAFVAGEIYNEKASGEMESTRLTLEDFRLIFRS